MAELDSKAINEFLAKQIVGHVGMIDDDGRPLVLPVYYIYEPPTVYFATEVGQRLTQLPKQPSICFEVEEVFPELGSYRSVIAYGHARVVDEPVERQRVLRLLMERFERQGPLWASSRYYPAHALSGHEDTRPLVAVGLTLSEASGRQLGAA